MSNETQNMINAATNKDGAAFKAAFDTVIQQKVGDTLEAQRVEVAKNVFGNIRVPSDVNEAPRDAADAARRAAKVERDDVERIVGRQKARREREASPAVPTVQKVQKKNAADKSPDALRRRAAKVDADDRQRIIGRQQARRQARR